MTKRISQPTTVVVPVPQLPVADGAAVAAKAVVAPAEADAVAVKDGIVEKAPVTVTIVAEPAMALVAPAPLAMVAEPASIGQTTDATTDSDTDESGEDMTAYIVGGALLAGGILAIALSSGDDDKPAPAPTPTPTPPPTNTVTFSSAATATVAENTPNTPTAPTVIDVNAAATQTGTITYTLGGADAALFRIDAATGVVTLVTSANFEAKPSYSITVTASSAGTPAASASQTIVVTVTNVNETPTFSSATAVGTVAENAPVATVIFDANATDPDAATTLIYALAAGGDAALLNINSATGEVTLKASADFETKPTYAFTVTASDAATGGLTATQTVTVNVTNVNETPRFAVASVAGTVPENIPTTQVVYTAVATDVDAGTTLSYSLGGTDAAAFAINATTGAITFRASPDFETRTSYTFTVIATDAATGGLAATQTVTLGVTNVNETPRFAVTSVTGSVPENVPTTQVIYTAVATDVDAGTTLSYSLGGTDAGAFAINPATGAITFRASPDFETKTSYTFTVIASDAATGGLAATQTVTINVTDVAEGPVFTSAATATIAENAAITTVVVDANATGATSFALGGADAARFNIDTATGVVTLRSSGNFEATPTKTTFNITVSATGPGGTSTQPVVVTLTDINEAPTFTNATATATAAENIPTTQVVFTPAATDPDAATGPNGQLTFSLTGTDAGVFAINPTTGAVTFRASPDFEATPTKTVFNFNVVATDAGAGAIPASQAVTLTLTNVVESTDGVRIDGGTIPATTAVSYSAATGNVTFLETGAAGNLSTINSFTAGDIISTDVATSNYSFTSNGTTLIISFNNNGVISRIELPNSVSNTAGIFNESSAEQAIGFDFFRSSAPAAPAATLSLDNQATVNATTNSFTFTDSATAANTTAINGFTADDRLVVSGTTTASFSSLNDDLIISFTNGGVVSRITINDVVSPNAGIFDEASAEAAVGFDFFRFG